MSYERTNQAINSKTAGKETKEQIMNTLKHISEIFQTKMNDDKFKQELWEKHIKDPSSIQNDNVFYLKSSASLKSEVRCTVNMIEGGDQPLDYVVRDLILKTTGRKSLNDLAKKNTLSEMDFSEFDYLPKKERQRSVKLVILLSSILWLPTMFIAYTHQQYSRYPERTKNIRCTNSSYACGVAKAFLERVNVTIEKITNSLKGEIDAVS